MDLPRIHRSSRDATKQNKVYVLVDDEIASKIEFDIDFCSITWVKTYDNYRNRGYVRLALGHTIEWIKSTGKCSQVSLTIAPQQNTEYTRLLKFYKEFGFRPVTFTDWIKTLQH
ncbi:N-acetyltransferase [Pacmanvirus A23]|uniref:N-acetyltransferase n=1 Tax=Pacmanvirus A23 TaxID=1932881 RepID=UPI000A09654B|nr:N-acetyltransferase [Pacmanvirus A23]SIP85747.1 N-acetyltransferase [Pacmanvirus A23]